MSKWLNLKIYWVTKIWPKWQIIIPKESREDLKIDTWVVYNISIIGKQWFWISETEVTERFLENELGKDCGSCNIWEIKPFWEIKIWTKYQFVIPNEIRKELWIDKWDNLMVLWKSDKWLGFIKNDNIGFLLDFIKSRIMG